MMKLGDKVVADGMCGVIVCDFDSREFAEGYEHLNPQPVDLNDGDIPSTGVMIKTVEAGLVHYGDGTCGIERVGEIGI
ncbi:MAG: hypothetical protein WA070_05520 [Sphingobium sp.]